MSGATITLKADALEREGLLAEGEPYFVPPYVGSKGWIGIRLDDPRIDWEQVAELIATSYLLTAPKRLAKLVVRPPSIES
jgi:predicted DNA-binding protein (MmcQ/YjbR family)